ncbi:MAG: hypothetical protein A2Y21_09225 [Clostridiales bacterium GWC2_40_7]|nr:MAG: hypothetical protein A2Y21_09225 [Clostridiales bacterium GWC2_40_7]
MERKSKINSTKNISNNEIVYHELIKHSRQLRSRFFIDQHRPAYHFVIPEGLAMSFDPNGLIFWKGRYHMFYIFQDPNLPRDGNCWGHVSSIDLVHWVHHPTALVATSESPEEEIWSGAGLINKDGVPTLVYYGYDVGICIATSVDDELNHWIKSPHNPIIPKPQKESPEYEVYNIHDPHVWLEGETYYLITGWKNVSNDKYSTKYLFKSNDLVNWKYIHPFYVPNPEWIDLDEDCSCPDFFQIGDRYMLLFVSHTRGTQYYLGLYGNETFYPEEHGRMNWPGGPCFAPETWLDDHGRRIMIAWACEQRLRKEHEACGWAGVMTIPRMLSLADDGSLRIGPVEELKKLRYNYRNYNTMRVSSGSDIRLQGIRGDQMELFLEILPEDTEEFGLKVRCSPDDEEQTVIVYSNNTKILYIDTSRSSLSHMVMNPFPYPYASFLVDPLESSKDIRLQKAPFKLYSGESLKLHVFIDHSIVEVYANERQCLTQRIYPTRNDSQEVVIFSRNGNITVKSFEVWDLYAINL